MSSFAELDEAVSFVQSFGNELSVLQCTTSYPTPPDRVGLNVIPELKERYKIPVGLSEHTSNIYAGIAAVAMGAELLEFHVVFNKEMFGPDATSSLTLDQTAQLVEGVDKSDNSQYADLKKIFEKSLAVNKDLTNGHTITFEDLEAKKPAGHGIAASKFRGVIGKKLKADLKKWDFLNEEHLT